MGHSVQDNLDTIDNRGTTALATPGSKAYHGVKQDIQIEDPHPPLQPHLFIGHLYSLLVAVYTHMDALSLTDALITP